MPIEKNIRINVDADQVGEARKELDKLDSSLKDVDKQAEKTSSEMQSVGDNGGAIATLDSLTGGLATRIKDAAEASKLFNGSLKGMRTALIATGIGVFVVALGLVVTYWDEIEEAITGAQKRLQSYLDLSNQQTDILQAQLSLLDKQIESAKLQGKATEALQEQRKVLLKQQQDLNKEQQGILRLQIARLKAVEQEIELTDVLGAAWAFIKGGAAGVAREAQDIAIKRRQEINELELALTNAEIKAQDLVTTLFKIDNPEGEGEPRENQEAISSIDDVRVKSRQTVNDLLIEEEKRLRAYELQSAGDTAQKIAEIEKRLADEKMLYQQKVHDFSVGLGSQTLDIISGLVKEGSDLAKGVAIAQATVDTYKGAVAAYAAGSSVGGPAGLVLGPIAAGLAVAAGLANIAKIASTKPIETAAPGRGGVAQAPAPSFNLVQGTASNQIANSVQSGTEPTKAFVVSKDVTSNQEMDRNIESTAVL